MKKINFRFFPVVAIAICFLIGLFAFTSTKSKPSKQTTYYYWEINTNGTLGTYLGSLTTTNARVTGCEGTTGDVCRRGYAVEELIDDEDPEAGPATITVSSDVIKKIVE